VFFHGLFARQVSKLGPGLRDKGFDVVFEAFGDAGSVVFELLEGDVLLVEEAFESLGITQRQVTAEDNAVEAGEDAVNLAGVLDKEGVLAGRGSHGVLLRAIVGATDQP
jgi:hypothetical protein